MARSYNRVGCALLVWPVPVHHKPTPRAVGAGRAREQGASAIQRRGDGQRGLFFACHGLWVSRVSAEWWSRAGRASVSNRYRYQGYGSIAGMARSYNRVGCALLVWPVPVHHKPPPRAVGAGRAREQGASAIQRRGDGQRGLFFACHGLWVSRVSAECWSRAGRASASNLDRYW